MGTPRTLPAASSLHSERVYCRRNSLGCNGCWRPAAGARVERKDDAGAWSTFLTYAYDSDDNRRQVTDATGRDSFFTYDGLDRLTGVADEASPPNTTGFAYDAAGNVTRVTDPKAQETDYAYDALSRLASVEQHLGQTVAYAYDGRGRPASTTNARGHVLRHAYFPWGGLEQVEEFVDGSAGTPTKTVSYTYDNEGSIATVSDSTAPGGPLLYTYAYDAVERVDTAIAHYVPGGNLLLDSDFDRFGNRKQLALTDGAATLVQGWTFDKLDRLVSAALAQGTTSYGYRANDELETLTRASGVQTTLSYFPHGPIDTITTRDGSATLLHLLDYSVDQTLNVDTISETRGTGSAQLFDYAYDGIDRLTQALNPTAFGLPASEDYAYDTAGNRETPGSPSAYDYDANNRILVSPPATTSYAFDADGNLQTKNAGLSTEERFTFDKTNRLAVWEKGPSGSPTGTASYAYDPFGRRIKKTANGTTTWFLWDGDVLAAEFDGSGSRTRRYTYDGGWAPTELVTKTGGAETAYAVTTDHLGTPRMLTNAAGVAVWRSSHESFGKAVVNEDPDGDSNLVAFNVRFPGQYADVETELHYNKFRLYDADAARYVSADPIGQGVSGVNTYLYVANRSVNRVDPLGLVDLNLFDPSDPVYPGAVAAESPDDTFTVGGHGNPTTVVDSEGNPLSADQLASMIQANPNYKPGQTVQLLSCNTGLSPGDGRPSFAQAVANALGGNVQGPDNFVWYSSDGDTFVAPMTPSGDPDRQTQGGYTTFKPQSQTPQNSQAQQGPPAPSRSPDAKK